MRVVLAGLLLVACLGCGGGNDAGERFAIYHLEVAIGRPGADGELHCGPPRAVCPGVVEQPPPREFRYAILASPAVTDVGVDRASARAATDPATGADLVTLSFTSEGTAAFARVTKEVAREGGRDQGWHHLAVVIGDEIVAFPEVDFDSYPDGFRDAPGMQITAVDAADARDMVERLRGG